MRSRLGFWIVGILFLVLAPLVLSPLGFAADESKVPPLLLSARQGSDVAPQTTSPPASRQSPEQNPGIFLLPKEGLPALGLQGDMTRLKSVLRQVLDLERSLFGARMGPLVERGIATSLSFEEMPEKKALQRRVDFLRKGQVPGALLGVDIFQLKAVLTQDNWGETNPIDPRFLTLENDRHLTSEDPIALDVQSGMGTGLAALGKFEDAWRYLAESYRQRRKLLGATHPLTVEASDALVRVLKSK